MDCPVVVLKSDACFTVEFLNRFVHIRPDMACVLNKKEIKSEFRAYRSPGGGGGGELSHETDEDARRKF